MNKSELSALIIKCHSATGKERAQLLDMAIDELLVLTNEDFRYEAFGEFSGYVFESALEKALDVGRQDFIEKYVSSVIELRNSGGPASRARDIVESANSRLLAYYLDSRKIDVSDESFSKCLSLAILNVNRTWDFHGHIRAALVDMTERSSFGSYEKYAQDAAGKRTHAIEGLKSYVAVPDKSFTTAHVDIDTFLLRQYHMFETFKVMEMLLDRGVPLEKVLEAKKDQDMLSIFRRGFPNDVYEPDIDYRLESCESPLLRIAYVSSPACAIVAGKRTADMDREGQIEGIRGRNALSYAAGQSDAELVEYLVKLGSRVDDNLLSDAVGDIAYNDRSHREFESLSRIIETLASVVPPRRPSVDEQFVTLVLGCPEEHLEKLLRLYIARGARGLDECGAPEEHLRKIVEIYFGRDEEQGLDEYGSVLDKISPKRRKIYEKAWESIGTELLTIMAGREGNISPNDVPEKYRNYVAHNLFTQLSRDAKEASESGKPGELAQVVVSCLAGAYESGTLDTNSPYYLAVERYAEKKFPDEETREKIFAGWMGDAAKAAKETKKTESQGEWEEGEEYDGPPI